MFFVDEDVGDGPLASLLFKVPLDLIAITILVESGFCNQLL